MPDLIFCCMPDLCFRYMNPGARRKRMLQQVEEDDDDDEDDTGGGEVLSKFKLVAKKKAGWYRHVFKTVDDGGSQVGHPHVQPKYTAVSRSKFEMCCVPSMFGLLWFALVLRVPTKTRVESSRSILTPSYLLIGSFLYNI